MRSPTRRRFFTQCVNPDSLLCKHWSSSSRGLNKVLFGRAAQDPMEEVYLRHPGPLYTVTGSKVLKAMKWRVTKDRNNWMGEIPKRELFSGTVSEYDWEKTFRELEKLEKNDEYATLTRSLLSTSTISTISTTTESDYSPKPPEKPKPIESMSSCHECGISVWMGDPEDVPTDMSVAYPKKKQWKEVYMSPLSISSPPSSRIHPLHRFLTSIPTVKHAGKRS